MSKLLWTERASFGPPARFVSGMTFDSDRKQTVLFGGQADGNILSDTWEWDGSFWTQVADTGPQARFSASLVYDTQLKATVLFGGSGANVPNDTWQWDGTDWTQLSDAGPSARNTVMAFDPTRSRTVLFGGGFDLGDTWEFDGESWTQMQDVGPPPRSGHGMAFDPVLQRVILFGGTGLNNTILNDTWAWTGTEWLQIAEFGPSPRFDLKMVSAGASGVLLFAGQGAIGPPAQILSDTWSFDGKRWTQRQDIGPGALNDPSMAFDSNRNRTALFGGQVPGPPDGHPTLSGLTWETPGVPPA